MLLHASANEEYPTTFDFLSVDDLTQIANDPHWENFDWNLYFQGDSSVEVYKLMVRGSDRVEGVVAIQVREDHVFVLLAESAPHNRGVERHFYRVGGHLFAIACQRSFDFGLDGYTAMDAKTGLIDYYKTTYQMLNPFGQRMIISEVAARQLIRLYLS